MRILGSNASKLKVKGAARAIANNAQSGQITRGPVAKGANARPDAAKTLFVQAQQGKVFHKEN